MNHLTGLQVEIDLLKKQLLRTAKIHEFNFGHPQVLEISQQLDQLIVKVMRYNR